MREDSFITPDQDRAGALQEAGAAAFRQGEYGEARRLFSRAHAAFGDGTGAMAALSDYGAACSALGDHAGARAAHEAALAGRRRMLGDVHPEVGASLHNLGAALRALGETGQAENCHAAALRIWEAALGPSHPMVPKALAALAALARERGDAQAALRLARRVLELRANTLQAGDPQIGFALDEMGRAQSAAGDDRAALRSWVAAVAILRPHFGDTPRLAPLLYNCGVAARAMEDLAAARDWFGRAVAADPRLAVARHNLASVLARLGDVAAASQQRELALRINCVFQQKAVRPREHVLIPSLADTGNVPLEHILPAREFTRIWWFIAHATDIAGAGLPHFGVVFNGIGDPDRAGPAGDRLRSFMAAKPEIRVLNHPDRVALTRRDRLESTLAGIGGVEVPRTCRIAGSPNREEIVQAARKAGIDVPFLLRPAGAHGGSGVQLVERWDAIDEFLLPVADAWYVSKYWACRGPDGYFRKYRVVFVDRVPYPYHLAISPWWLVHYFSADMEAHDWKLAEEAAFLADPRLALGSAGHATLEALGARLDLDFCGIDCALLPDGRLLVFEANPTMLIHPEKESGKLGFKNAAVRTVIDAVVELVAGSKAKSFSSEEKKQKTFVSGAHG